MAQVTLTIKQLIENDVEIFDTSYPIFDESYRAVLEQHIIDYYYFREIGVETPGRFKFNLNARLRLIMPYYNKKFLASNLEQRILDNYQVTESFTKSASTDGTDSNKNLYSDTPQGRTSLSDTEFVTNINELDGATHLSNLENWTRTMGGNIGVQTDAEAVKVYCDNLMNVNQMIIDELADLFLQLY